MSFKYLLAVMERVDAVIESMPPCSATYTLRLLAHADDQRQVSDRKTAALSKDRRAGCAGRKQTHAGVGLPTTSGRCGLRVVIVEWHGYNSSKHAANACWPKLTTSGRCGEALEGFNRLWIVPLPCSFVPCDPSACSEDPPLTLVALPHASMLPFAGRAGEPGGMQRGVLCHAAHAAAVPGGELLAALLTPVLVLPPAHVLLLLPVWHVLLHLQAPERLRKVLCLLQVNRRDARLPLMPANRPPAACGGATPRCR